MYKAIAVFLLPFLLTGCWSGYEVQNINYITAIGLDYEEEKYVIYAQLLDFSTVGKLELQQKAEEPPVWLGRGEGNTLTEAANDLYTTSQQRLNWGQISAILFSERLLKEERVEEVLELINRYREIRYICWVFSTRESLDKLLIATPFFRLSPKASILHNPEQHYRQRSLVAPVRLQNFVMDSNEKAKIGYIPELSVRDDQWKENHRAQELLKYSGIQLYDHSHYYGRMGLDEIQGLPWLNRHTVRLPLDLFDGDRLVAVVVAEEPEYDIKPTVQHGKAYFDISVKVKVGVNELHADVTERELRRMAQQKIEDQIRETYQLALEKNADIYNLGESLYRKNPNVWKRVASGNMLSKDSLRTVHVDAQLVYAGRYKFSP